ncbi:phospholipase A and acyltransferase 3-like [Patiria miniata]|uniref:LRAT domain-containing protein n=1 Tax=Patiria miniata TaxID=46514 RepID=A0A913ZF43_PATMI|nr:phospholipase A and acyltransferase 3-like [Patiria miniata]
MSNKGIKSDWFPSGPDGVEELRTRVEPGDLLEFKCPYFRHWGIYVGQDVDRSLRVINFRRRPSKDPNKENKRRSRASIFARSLRSPHVVEDTPLRALQGRYRVRINNAKDQIWTPFGGGEVVERAREELRAARCRVRFHLMLSNCEHFANFCRYGVPWSGQVERTVFHSFALHAFAVQGLLRDAVARNCNYTNRLYFYRWDKNNFLFSIAY